MGVDYFSRAAMAAIVDSNEAAKISKKVGEWIDDGMNPEELITERCLRMMK